MIEKTIKSKKFQGRRHTAPEIFFTTSDSQDQAQVQAQAQAQKQSKNKKELYSHNHRLQPSRLEGPSPPRPAKESLRKMSAKAVSVESTTKRKVPKWSQQLEAQPEVPRAIEEMHAVEVTHPVNEPQTLSPVRGKARIRSANRVPLEVKPLAALIEDEEPPGDHETDSEDDNEKYLDGEHWLDEKLSPELRYMESGTDNSMDNDSPDDTPAKKLQSSRSLDCISYFATPSLLSTEQKEDISPFRQVPPSTPAVSTDWHKVPTPPSVSSGSAEKDTTSKILEQTDTEDSEQEVTVRTPTPQHLEERQTVLTVKKVQRRAGGQLYRPRVVVSIKQTKDEDAAMMTERFVDESAHAKLSKYSVHSNESDKVTGETHSAEKLLSQEQSQAVLEQYNELAAITSMDVSQMKVMIRKLGTMREASESKEEKGSLPSFLSIDYMKNLAPLGPVEPGMRLLKSVTISTKSGESEDSSSEAGSKKWKLSVDMPDHDSGETKYGILNMGWTTHLPMATVDAQRRDNQLSHILPPAEASAYRHPEYHMNTHEHIRKRIILPELAKQKKSNRKKARPLFEWDDMPLPLLDCKERHTCDYYRLLKKQMHHHLSDRGHLQLPKLHNKDRVPEGKPDWTRQSIFGLQYM